MITTHANRDDTKESIIKRSLWKDETKELIGTLLAQASVDGNRQLLSQSSILSLCLIPYVEQVNDHASSSTTNDTPLDTYN